MCVVSSFIHWLSLFGVWSVCPFGIPGTTELIYLNPRNIPIPRYHRLSVGTGDHSHHDTHPQWFHKSLPHSRVRLTRSLSRLHHPHHLPCPPLLRSYSQQSYLPRSLPSCLPSVLVFLLRQPHSLGHFVSHQIQYSDSVTTLIRLLLLLQLGSLPHPGHLYLCQCPFHCDVLVALGRYGYCGGDTPETSSPVPGVDTWGRCGSSRILHPPSSL